MYKIRFITNCLNGKQIHAQSRQGLFGGCEVDQRYIKGTIDVDLVFKKDFTGKQECIGTLIPTMLETSTNAGLQRDMCLYYPKHRSAGSILCILMSHCLLRRPSI